MAPQPIANVVSSIPKNHSRKKTSRLYKQGLLVYSAQMKTQTKYRQNTSPTRDCPANGLPLPHPLREVQRCPHPNKKPCRVCPPPEKLLTRKKNEGPNWGKPNFVEKTSLFTSVVCVKKNHKTVVGGWETRQQTASTAATT